MKRFAFISLLFMAFLASTTAWLLRSPQTQVQLLHTLVDRLTGLQLLLEQPDIDLFAGRVRAKRLALYPPDNPAQPHFNVQNLRVVLSRPEQVGELIHTAVSAAAVTVFASDSGGSVNPSPQDWINYLNRLPDNIHVTQFHLVSAQADTRVISASEVVGERLRDSQYQLGFLLRQGQELLTIEATVDGKSGLKRGSTLSGTVSITDTANSSIDLSGHLQGDQRKFEYQMSMSAQLPALNAYRELIVLQSGAPMNGALLVNGELSGDQTSFKVEQARISLNNAPAYNFQATGTLDYAFSGDSNLDLDATGQLNDMSLLLNWIDLDLSALGQARAKLTLTGALNRLRAKTFTLSTFDNSGLQVDISGSGSAGNEVDTAMQVEDLRFELSGPRLAVVEPWVGDIPFDPGPWQALGRLQQNGQTFTVSDMRVSAGRKGEITLQGEHGSARYELASADSPAKLTDVRLPLTLTAPKMTMLSPLITLPESLAQWLDEAQLSSTATLLSQGDNWALTNIDATLSQPGLKIHGAGKITRLTTRPRIDVLTTLKRVDLSSLSPWYAALEKIDGYLVGEAHIQGTSDALSVAKLSLEARNIAATQLSFEGQATNLTSRPQGKARLNWRSENVALMQRLTSLPLLMSSGQWNIGLAKEGLVDIDGQANLGGSTFNAAIKLDQKNGQLARVVANISSPGVTLSDLGFDGSTADKANNKPDTSTPSSLRFSTWLNKAPAFPLSLAVDIGPIIGERTRINSFQAKIDASDKRYTLRQFTVKYRDSVAEVRGLIDHNADTPFFSAAIDAQQVALSRLLNDLDMAAPVEGLVSLRAGVSGSGDTPHKLVESLNGSVSFAMEDANIVGGAYDLLATDTLAWLFTGGASKETTRLDCTMASFDLRQGVAHTDSLFIESPSMIATGKGNINFHNDALNIKLTPYSKSRRLHVPATVKIKGTLAEPAIYPSVAKAAIDATAEALSLVPKLILKVFGADKYKTDVRPCEPQV